MKTMESTNYIAPEVYFVADLRCSLCAGSGDASYAGVEIESLVTGDEISFD